MNLLRNMEGFLLAGTLVVGATGLANGAILHGRSARPVTAPARLAPVAAPQAQAPTVPSPQHMSVVRVVGKRPSHHKPV